MSEAGPQPPPWHYEPARDLNQPLTERLRHFPREPEMIVYAARSLAALVIRGWLRLFHRLEINGRENLPATGSFVLVANHGSHLDAPCLLAALPLRKLHRAFPAAAADYFFQSVPRTWIAAVVVNALPFARQVQVRESLGLCEALLANPGNVLILFPEGTRTATGEVNAFKPGIGALLAGRDIPVLPCRLHGAFAAWPRHRAWPLPRKIRLTIGAPRCYATLAPNKESARQIGEELREAVLALGH
jgi:1-acyl-sn-glycerol-3-phosphate acyltransferase